MSGAVRYILGAAFASLALAGTAVAQLRAYDPEIMMAAGAFNELKVTDDVDGDGAPEFVAISSNFPAPGQVDWISSATGSIVKALNLLADRTPLWDLRLMDDVDGDGERDVVFRAGGFFGTPRRIIAVGSAGPSVLWEWTQPANSDGIVLVEVGNDLNGDGLRDIIGVSFNERRHMNAVDGSVIAPGDASLLATPNDINAAAVPGFDLDGDGVKDLLWCRRRLPSFPQLEPVEIRTNTATPSSVIGQMNPPPGATSFGWQIGVVSDINGDGRREIVVGSREAQQPSSTTTIYLCDWWNNVVLQSVVIQGWSDRWLSSIGDVNADGFDDFCLRVQGATVCGDPSGQAVLFLSGLNLEKLVGFVNPAAGFQLNGGDAYPAIAGGVVVYGNGGSVAFGVPGTSAIAIELAYGDRAYGTGSLALQRAPYGSNPRQGPITISGAEANAPALVVLSTARDSMVLPGTSLEVLVDLNQVLVWADGLTFDGAGQLSFPLDLANPLLTGQAFFMQAASFGMSGPQVSNGLEIAFTR
jgi:FG-GAP repeat protein